MIAKGWWSLVAQAGNLSSSPTRGEAVLERFDHQHTQSGDSERVGEMLSLF